MGQASPPLTPYEIGFRDGVNLVILVVAAFVIAFILVGQIPERPRWRTSKPAKKRGR